MYKYFNKCLYKDYLITQLQVYAVNFRTFKEQWNLYYIYSKNIELD